MTPTIDSSSSRYRASMLPHLICMCWAGHIRVYIVPLTDTQTGLPSRELHTYRLYCVLYWVVASNCIERRWRQLEPLGRSQMGMGIWGEGGSESMEPRAQIRCAANIDYMVAAQPKVAGFGH